MPCRPELSKRQSNVAPPRGESSEVNDYSSGWAVPQHAKVGRASEEIGRNAVPCGAKNCSLFRRLLHVPVDKPDVGHVHMLAIDEVRLLLQNISTIEENSNRHVVLDLFPPVS